ncbi:MAG: hypothetical protein AAFQ94_26990 [Bacteroidota bacterium]
MLQLPALGATLILSAYASPNILPPVIVHLNEVALFDSATNSAMFLERLDVTVGIPGVRFIGETATFSEALTVLAKSVVHSRWPVIGLITSENIKYVIEIRPFWVIGELFDGQSTLKVLLVTVNDLLNDNPGTETTISYTGIKQWLEVGVMVYIALSPLHTIDGPLTVVAFN